MVVGFLVLSIFIALSFSLIILVHPFYVVGCVVIFWLNAFLGTGNCFLWVWFFRIFSPVRDVWPVVPVFCWGNLGSIDHGGSLFLLGSKSCGFL